MMVTESTLPSKAIVADPPRLGRPILEVLVHYRWPLVGWKFTSDPTYISSQQTSTGFALTPEAPPPKGIPVLFDLNGP